MSRLSTAAAVVLGILASVSLWAAGEHRGETVGAARAHVFYKNLLADRRRVYFEPGCWSWAPQCTKPGLGPGETIIGGQP